MALKKITEPDENKVHYGAYPGQDAVTLCGLTDWIKITEGVRTAKPVTCNACKAIVRHVRANT